MGRRITFFMIGASLLILGFACAADPRTPLRRDGGPDRDGEKPRTHPFAPGRNDPYTMPEFPLHAVDPGMVVRPDTDVGYKLLILNPLSRTWTNGGLPWPEPKPAR
jgi:hypothetical protein